MGNVNFSSHQVTNKNRALLTKYISHIYNLVKLDDLTMHLLGELDGSFLTREDSDFLMSAPITHTRAHSLINIISCKGEEAIPAFMRALQKSDHRGHKELYDMLKQELGPATSSLEDSSDTEIDTDGLLPDQHQKAVDENLYRIETPTTQVYEARQWMKVIVCTTIVLAVVVLAGIGVCLITLGITGYTVKNMHCKEPHILEFFIVAGVTILLAVPNISLVVFLLFKKSEEPSYKQLRRCILILLVPLVISVLLAGACHLIYWVMTIVTFASHDFDVDKVKCGSVHEVAVLVMVLCTLLIIIGALVSGVVIFCVKCVCCRPQGALASRAIA